MRRTAPRRLLRDPYAPQVLGSPRSLHSASIEDPAGSAGNIRRPRRYALAGGYTVRAAERRPLPCAMQRRQPSVLLASLSAVSINPALEPRCTCLFRPLHLRRSSLRTQRRKAASRSALVLPSLR